MNRPRRLLAVVTSLLLPLAALTVLTTSAPAAAEPDRPAGTTPRVVLTDDVVRPEGSPLSARIRSWPGNRIRYHESIPRKWDWSLRRAIDHWNSSGGNVRFVEVSKERAQLVIRYGPTFGADGIGTLGYQQQNYVHLSTAYKRVDQFVPEIRVWVGRLFTHELGHVLGFEHTGGQCSLMFPVYDFGACPPLPDDAPGYYYCRWIDKPLLRRFTRIYGGSPKRPPKLCLIEPLPGQLRDVEFGGGAEQSAPVRITWRPPSRIRPGTKTRVTVWPGSSCGGELPDTWERRVVVDTREGVWTDPAYGQGSWCYRLQIENRYGATRRPHSAAMQRYAPVLEAPDIRNPMFVEEEGGYRVTWVPPDDSTRLAVMRSFEDPLACVTTYDAFSAEGAGMIDEETWQVTAYAAEECLTFFAVSEAGLVSAPTSIVIGSARMHTVPVP